MNPPLTGMLSIGLFTVIRAYVIYKFIQAEDKAFLNGDSIWNTGDDSDSEALKAFQSVIYVSS
jgi:endonuclease YncB( thermonuclease family)